MEQSSASQNPMSELHRASVTSNSIPPEYWNALESLYPGSEPQLQHQHPPQQQQRQRQPLGINWDHPVFSQETQTRNHQPVRQEPDHGIYSQTPQSWQPNPLHQSLISPSPQEFGVPSQYHHEVQQYPQGQMTFDSPSLTPSENPSYQQFPISQNYYPSQHLPVQQDTFSQPSSQGVHSQSSQTTSYQSANHQTPLNQYMISPGYPGDRSNNPINLTNGYHEPAANVSDQSTINPQFLNTSQQAASQQSASLHNNFLYVSPADFERQDGSSKPGMFNYYQNDLQMPPDLAQPMMNQGVPVRSPGFGVLAEAESGMQTQFRPLKVADSTKKKPGPKKQSQTKKASAASAKKPGESESDYTSDESDLEIVPDEPSPIPATRPTEPAAAAEYDTLKAVWSPRNKVPKADTVKSALVAFKDVVKAVRDTWKEHTQAMKMAENKDQGDKAAQFKKDAALQRRLMDVVVTTTLEKGHPMIVEKLGEHPIAVAAMYSFLLDRHQASDYDGTLTVNILKLFSHFVTVDEDVLQKTNVAKLLPRFLKKGGQPVKELAQKVLDNAAASTKRKQENGKSASKENSPGNGSPLNSAASDGTRAEIAGSKRIREVEGNGLPANKRMIVTSNPKSATKPGNPGSTLTKRPQDASQDAKSTNTTASRPKANIVAPKPTNLFGSLSSASKRPGTSNAERAAAAAAKTSASTEKKDTPPQKPAFSFGDIMADLNKQKEPAVPEPTEDKLPETEEERQKRLRKEERRKLRVTWKPEESLTEVRLFTHDPEEELGPGDRPSREIGDVKGEGRALKLHKDVDELADEDDGIVREETFLTYQVPSEIDNGEITADDRARNFIKRLGTQEPDSTEKKAQEHREATTLMVFYTSPADVPPSPKEPPPPSDDEIVTDEIIFGELPDHVKARQERYFAMVNPKPAPLPQQNPPNNGFDISNLLKIIQSAPQQQSTPPPAPAPAAPMNDLERTISMFRQQQKFQQPVPQMPQMPVSQPSATQGLDFQKILGVINAQKQIPQASMFPQAQPTQSAVAPNLAAIVSQFANQNQHAGAQQAYEDPERKRMREPNGFDGAGDDRFKRNKFNAPNKKHPKAGSVPCRYWREGKCLKGDDCTFRHDPLN